MEKAYFVVTLNLAALMILGGCATQSPHADRRISAAGQGAIIEFMDSLSRQSTNNDFEKAFIATVNKDADGSLSNIRSIEDLRSLSPEDQVQLVKRLAADPALKDALGLSSDDAVNAARNEAMSASEDTRAVVTTGVADLRAGGFSSEALAAEDADIRHITGISVLGERASSVSGPEAQRTLQKVVQGLHDDAVGGKLHTAADVEKDADEQVAKAEDVNQGIAHNRRCRLAQPVNDKGCGVLSKPLYADCDE